MMTFEEYYDTVTGIAKDPVVCRQFWEAGQKALLEEIKQDECTPRSSIPNTREVLP